MATRNIFRAASMGDVESLRKLLKKGADVNAKDEQQLPPLHYAAYRGRTNTLTILLEYGAEVNTCNAVGYTPLMVAAREGWDEVVRLLVEHGSDVNATTTDGQTALSFAGEYGSPAVIGLLLEHGADCTGEAGGQALLGAAYNGHVENVRVLLAAGANIHATTSAGKTALEFASDPSRTASGRAIIKPLLLQAGATR